MHRDLNLRHMILIELLKDYDMSVHYHPGKANLLVDVLHHLSKDRMVHIDDENELVKKVHQLSRLGVRLVDTPNGVFHFIPVLNHHLL